jgi:hypothetical protein
MINRGALVWMILAITAGTGLFLLKYEVRAMEEQLVQIKQQTLNNLEAVHVLKAEWSHLNQPMRLEDLGRRLLSLEPIVAQQSVSITDIPMRPVPVRHDATGLSAAEGAPRFPEISPAAGQGPPLFATYRRVQ